MYIWVIPNHFNKSLQVTLSELDETWYVSSACGFMKPDKIPLLVHAVRPNCQSEQLIRLWMPKQIASEELVVSGHYMTFV